MKELMLGGVRFCLHHHDDWVLDAEDAELAWPADTAPVATQASLTLIADASLKDSEDAAIAWHRTEGRLSVRSRGMRAVLVEQSAGAFEGEARLSTALTTTSSLLNALACALIYARGGLVLHAVGLVERSELTAVIGPPDAGKTTAANLCTGSCWYARDRLVVAEVAGRIFAWPLAGGEDIHLPHYTGLPLRLSELVRVSRDAGDTRIEDVSVEEAALLIRESTHAPADVDEGHLLDRSLWLASHLPVRRLHSRLDAPLSLRFL